MNEWGVARSSIDYEQKLYSQDLIKWKIIEWGIENKMNWYDLSGINPNPVNSKERGILQYKKKWGGEKVQQWIFKNLNHFLNSFKIDLKKLLVELSIK